MALRRSHAHLPSLPREAPRLAPPLRRTHRAFATTRSRSSPSATSPLAWARSQSRVSTIFALLIGLGVASTSYGVYQFYTTFTLWPPEVRGDLRAGIKAKNQGDLDLSERYLRRAWTTALARPLADFGAEPHLKLSGIAIALSEVLEANNRVSAAYDVYADALAQLRAASAPALSGRERMRAVALAHRLGELAEALQMPEDDEERWLSTAVEEALRAVGRTAAEGDADTVGMLAELELPWWVEKTDVAAPMEALGRFYARTGKAEYATTLYLQAIGVLMPASKSSTRQASVEDRCRAAQLMNNLSDLMANGPPPDNVKYAMSWADQAKGVIEKTKASARPDAEGLPLCEQTLAAVLYNLGMLLEMSGDRDKARASFKDSLDQANRIGMRAGAMEARAALRRLDRASNTAMHK